MNATWRRIKGSWSERSSEIGSYLGQSDHVALVCQVSPAVDRGEAALAAALPWVRPAIALAALLARDGFVPRVPSSLDLLEEGYWSVSPVFGLVGLGGTWRTLAMA